MASTEVSAASWAKGSSRSRIEAVFFPLMALLIVATVVLGFARTFFLAPMYHNELPNSLVAVHGTVFSAWVALFAVQATLVPVGRVALHKRLGVAGAVLLGLVVLLGYLIMLEGVWRDVSRPGLDQTQIFSLNLVGFNVAVGLLSCGLVFRRDPQTHKRLMLLGTVALVGPAVVRWPFGFVALHPPVVGLVLDAFTIFTIALDLGTRGRVHRATLVGGAAIFVVPPIALSLSSTPALHHFLNWLHHALLKL